MILKASMDKNVTWQHTIKYLSEIGIIDKVDIAKIFDKNETLNINIEIKNSIVCENILNEQMCVSVINQYGASIFVLDDSALDIFIPMNNILSLSIEDKEAKELIELSKRKSN